MPHRASSLCAIFAIFFTVAYAAVEPIWISPTNVDLTIPGGTDFSNIAESYVAERGAWANLTVGAGSRAYGSVVVMDSKGTLWIMGGFRHQKTAKEGQPLFSVWNYDPKRDLYRYVWGSPEWIYPKNPRNPGELHVEADTNHPGFVWHSSATIDNNDNIWFYSSEYVGELWMFNTTSMMFVRQFGLDGNNDNPSVGTPGRAGENVWPGATQAACTVVDSQNNIWMLGGGNNDGNVNAVWHFNTTLLLWTFMAGSIEETSGNSTHPGGLWSSGCNIDENDKIWLYGGYGDIGVAFDDSPYLWTFDTRGDRDYKFEAGPAVLSSFDQLNPVSVSSDYDPSNHPGGCEGCMLVDRMDGTLMLLADYTYTADGSYGGTNQVWQYSKSLKQWKFVYGDIDNVNQLGTYVDYRQPGSKMPCRAYGSKTNGKNMMGDVFSVGGGLYQINYTKPAEIPGFKDIWLIPNDQCSSPTANKCDPNADCIEEMIGYSCECKQGYTGDGFTCTFIPPVAPVAPVASMPSAAPSKAPTSTPSSKISSASVVSASIVVVALAVIAL